MNQEFLQLVQLDPEIKKLAMLWNTAEELKDESPKLYFYILFLLVNKLRGKIKRDKRQKGKSKNP